VLLFIFVLPCPLPLPLKTSVLPRCSRLSSEALESFLHPPCKPRLDTFSHNLSRPPLLTSRSCLPFPSHAVISLPYPLPIVRDAASAACIWAARLSLVRFHSLIFLASCVCTLRAALPQGCPFFLALGPSHHPEQSKCSYPAP
jgi:hypothetical protein